MFHVTDGLFFERLPEGKVRILKRADGAPVIFEQTIDADSWCSVIASMSYYGEEDYGFYRAANFHKGESIPETVRLVDKQPA